MKFIHVPLQQEENNTSQVVVLSKEDEEIERYLRSRLSMKEMELDPLDYWIQMKHLYPLLFPIASAILSTPASTAPVERVFSASGEVTKGK